jgi:hypothetical protein
MFVDGKVVHRLVHRLLMEAFGPARPEGCNGVRHLDGDSSNNDLRNLAWGSQADNMADDVRLGRTRRGTQQKNAKLTPTDVLAIRRLHASGESIAALARQYPVHANTVRKIIRREKWAWLPDELIFE